MSNNNSERGQGLVLFIFFVALIVLAVVFVVVPVLGAGMGAVDGLCDGLATAGQMTACK